MIPLHVFLCYLLSLCSGAHATLAIQQPEQIPWIAGGFLLCAVFGPHFLAGASTARRDPSKLLASLWIVYVFTLVMTWLFAHGGNWVLLSESLDVLLLFQGAFLFGCTTHAGYRSCQWNSVMLTGIALLAGGPVAILALVGSVALMSSLLAIETITRFGLHARHFWRLVAPTTGPLLLGLTIVLLVASPAPYTPRGGPPLSSRPPEELWTVYVELLILGLLGASFLLWIRRKLGRSDLEGELTEEEPESTVLGDEPLPTGGRLDVLRGRRAEIGTVYLRFLDGAGSLGIRRRPDWTPAEFGRRLPRSAQALTHLFAAARYGPEEPSSRDVDTAETAARATLEELRRPR